MTSLISLIFLTTTLHASTAMPAATHERLQVRNTFKTPEEVVRYYCGRDASGFVWSGLLDIERRNFTLWKELPQHDSFFIATSYEIKPARLQGDSAEVEVHYLLEGMGDAHGTIMPPPEPEISVVFQLRRTEGAWKIADPDSGQITPFVLASKFPQAGTD